MNHFVKSLGLTLFGVSIAFAESQVNNGPVELSALQMDQVTAGLGAIALVGATADSSVFVITHTEAVAFTAVTDNSNPAFGGYVEVGGGGAVAVGAGEGSTTDTSVVTATSTDGLNGSLTSYVGGYYKNDMVEINAQATYTVGGVFNPF